MSRNLALPKPVESDNLSLNKVVVRRMAVNVAQQRYLSNAHVRFVARGSVD